jgi:leucyl-tRNA---protein transferase
MDALWSHGWRHFGNQFFRYSLTIHQGAVARVLPLRIHLGRWAPSKSQARVLRRNQDLEVKYDRPQLDEEHQSLFARHTQRFTSNIPERLETFLGSDPGRRQGPWSYPCECVEVSVRRQGVLVAVSYLDIGREGASSVYASFDPTESARSLGTATFLWEIAYARSRGCRYLYPGYAYDISSPYDYKKRLGALEAFDWTLWRPFSPT